MIPAKHEVGMYREEVILPDWPLQVRAVISSVSDRNSASLRELERLGLLPGVALAVEKNSNSSLVVRVESRGESTRLDRDLANCILVAAS
jgi:Fe2+ transport system protein FeoA